MDTPKKRCSKCEKLKPLDDFMKCALAKDGRAGHCKACAPPRKKRQGGVAQIPRAIEEGAGPLVRSEPSIGFAAQRQGADIVIEQESADGVATVWLSMSEAGQLAEWLASQVRERTPTEPAQSA